MNIDEIRFAQRVLRRMRELIAQNWCQGSMAKNSDGISVGPEKRYAESWCLLGANYRARFEIMKGGPPRNVYQDPTFRFLSRSVDSVWQGMETNRNSGYGSNMTMFNDAKDRTQEDVLAVIDGALEEAAREEQNRVHG